MEQGAGGSRRTRSVASIVLAIVGTVFLFVGGLTLYVREEVFDADSFAQNASDALGDDRVDTAIANPLVDAVIRSGPDELINARPVDFYDEGNVFEAARRLNRLPRKAEPEVRETG